MSVKRFDNSKRVAWRDAVERATETVRRARAERLRARGRRLAALERRAHMAELVRGSGGNPRVGTPVRRGDRVLGAMPRIHPWHASRALGVEEVFRRVEDCGDDFQAVARCSSHACRRAREKNPEAGLQRIPLGCSSRLFCDDCKLRIAARFRREFNAARLGLWWAARQQGRQSKWRPKFGPEARFGERLITLTAPHVGTPRERVRWLFKAWPEFLKRLNEWQRTQLGDVACTEGKARGDGNDSSIPVDADGSPIELVRQLCHLVRVFEWTPGTDGDGHPHFHLWHFGPFIPQELLATWWDEAWTRVSGRAADRRAAALASFEAFVRTLHTGSLAVAALMHREATSTLLVDVRKVRGDSVDDGKGDRTHVANELIKYLTKDWGADPEIFAEFYAEIAERRARQTSSGFSRFSVQLIRVCETCGCVHESETGFSWRIEATAGEPQIERAMARAPPFPIDPDYVETEKDVVARLFEEAYVRRTTPERAEIRRRLWS